MAEVALAHVRADSIDEILSEWQGLVGREPGVRLSIDLAAIAQFERVAAALVSNALLGYIRRRALTSSFVADEWEMRDAYNNLIGEIKESTGRGLARKYVPGGALIPEKLTMTLMGQPVAYINQQFKIIGDIWEIQCQALPASFDRRVFLSGVILMGMIERARK